MHKGFQRESGSHIHTRRKVQHTAIQRGGLAGTSLHSCLDGRGIVRNSICDCAKICGVENGRSRFRSRGRHVSRFVSRRCNLGLHGAGKQNAKQHQNSYWIQQAHQRNAPGASLCRPRQSQSKRAAYSRMSFHCLGPVVSSIRSSGIHNSPRWLIMNFS